MIGPGIAASQDSFRDGERYVVEFLWSERGSGEQAWLDGIARIRGGLGDPGVRRDRHVPVPFSREAERSGGA